MGVAAENTGLFNNYILSSSRSLDGFSAVEIFLCQNTLLKIYRHTLSQTRWKCAKSLPGFPLPKVSAKFKRSLVFRHDAAMITGSNCTNGIIGMELIAACVASSTPCLNVFRR